MKQKPVVSVVIGTYNRLDFLKPTIETVRQELDNTAGEIIVVDGGSTDGTIKWLTEQKDIISIIQHNRGEWRGRAIKRQSWGYFMNLGFKAAHGKYVCMLSDDCLIVPGAITNGVSLFDKKLKADQKIGALAFYWRNWPEQQNYWVGQTWGDRMFVNHGLYLNEALQKVDYVDEGSYIFYHADGDLCLRMWQAGYKCLESPDSYIEHFSEANAPVRASNQATQQQDWTTYSQRWSKLGEPQQPWIEKAYTDKYQTAKKYWPAQKKLIRKFWK